MKYKNKKFLSILFALIVLPMAFPGMPVSAATDSSVTTIYQMNSGGTTSADISIKNGDSVDHNYTLVYDSLPNDFHGYFTKDGKVVREILIPASSESNVTFSVDVPAATTTTKLAVPLNITRDDGKSETLTLSYSMNQDYTVSISSNLSLIKAINGDSITLDIGVTNTGNKDLTSLTLNAEPPYKWITESLEPNTLDLKSGETAIFKAKISIPTSQQAGEYPIKLTCSNAQITSNELTVPVAVSTSFNYFWWVAGSIIVLILFTLFYFKKHGRR